MPWVPLGKVVVVMATAALIVTVYAWLPVCAGVALSVPVMVKLKLPVAVGVPLSTPVLARVKPVGSVPVVVAKVYGPVPPVAVMVWL